MAIDTVISSDAETLETERERESVVLLRISLEKKKQIHF